MTAGGSMVDFRQLGPETQLFTHTDARWPGPGVPFCALHEIFELQADRRPDSVAVEFGRAETTYAELERRANRIARCLRARGVRRGGRVALLLLRSPDAYAAMLGVLKAGAAYVPLDPDYPPERVAFILQNSEASVLVTTTALTQRLAAFRGVVLRMDAEGAVIAAEIPARLPRGTAGVGPGDLCYIIYTSGSTSHPKGVMVEHRSTCHLVRQEVRLFGVRASDRVYQGAPLAFDLSVEEIWLAFQSGATLIAATPQMAQAGPDLARHLTAHGVTVLSCVPSLLSVLGEDVPSIRLVIVGGEPCPQKLVKRWARPGRRMLNSLYRRGDFPDPGRPSLPAARLVSELRQDPRFGRVSVLDVFEHPTIASLAAALEEAGGAAREVGETKAWPKEPAAGRRHFLAGMRQCLGVYAALLVRRWRTLRP